MKTNNTLRNLRLAIYTPMIFGAVLLGLDLLGRISDYPISLNWLFSRMSPMQVTGGSLLFLGINTYAYFVAYKKSLGEKQ